MYRLSLSWTGAVETRSVPEWSTKHFEATGRPLRIAVDQASWWYRDITVDEEAEWKAKSPGSHPREERIMERILYLLRMNIQLLFIFDGVKKPTKSRPAEYKYSESNIRFLKELLHQLNVPRHDAPGDAIAECVRLQELGIVDAIWTDNTDALMFGATPTLVDFNNESEGDHFGHSNTVVVVSGTYYIRDRADLTREWFLMYATLVGCSYADGLKGFSAAKFFRFAQDGSFQDAANLLLQGVEKPLVLNTWRHMATTMIHRVFPDADIATPGDTFPDMAVLEACVRPVISSDATLRDLPCLHEGWFRPYGPDMLSRYRFLLSNFNKEMPVSWIARALVPIQLTHYLRSTPPGNQVTNRQFEIEIKSKRGDSPESTITITIDPLKVLPELQTAFPKEIYRISSNKTRTKIEPPTFRPQGEELTLLATILRHGLPETDLPTPSTPSKKPPITLPSKKAPIPPPKNRNYSHQPRRSQNTHTKKPAPPTLSLNTHLLPSSTLDARDSPSFIHFHRELTFPGELDWPSQPGAPFSALPLGMQSPMSAHLLPVNPKSAHPLSTMHANANANLNQNLNLNLHGRPAAYAPSNWTDGGQDTTAATPSSTTQKPTGGSWDG
ncbi:PIN domain-like protein [Xylaria sp. CBS 124048]|nr:PIN domain-like protein [Xylaria sp. CBS 124048]